MAIGYSLLLLPLELHLSFLLGAISIDNLNEITLMDLLMADPPSFALIGDTRGGPPEISTWTRNGEVISDNDSYRISLAVNEVNRIDVFATEFDDTILRQSRYRSTLTVTGNLPGVYVYSVINRAMSAPRTAIFTIEGISFTIACISMHIIGNVYPLIYYCGISRCIFCVDTGPEQAVRQVIIIGYRPNNQNS